MQKEFTTDFLTKKKKVNEGEVPQYYVEDSHPAIIDPMLWEIAQMEIERRKQVGKSYSANGVFAGRIICGECGSVYGPRKYNTKSGVQTVWRCGKKYGKGNSCSSPILTEAEVMAKFVDAFNEVYDDRDEILESCRVLLEELDDTSDLDMRIQEHELQCEILADMNLKIMKNSAVSDWDNKDVREEIDRHVKKYDEEYAEAEKLKAIKQDRIRRAEMLSLFMFGLKNRDGVIETFDEKLWITTVDTVKVKKNGDLVFAFKNGTEVTR